MLIKPEATNIFHRSYWQSDTELGNIQRMSEIKYLPLCGCQHQPAKLNEGSVFRKLLIFIEIHLKVGYRFTCLWLPGTFYCCTQKPEAKTSWCQDMYICSFFPYCRGWPVRTITVCTVNIILFGISHHLSSHWGVKCFNRLCVPVSLMLPVSLFLCLLFEVSLMQHRCLGSHSKCLLNMKMRDRAEVDLFRLCYSHYDCHMSIGR